MESNRSPALTLMLEDEGGYSNHPDDPGGPTMRGVTTRVYDAFRKNAGQVTRDVRKMTTDEMMEIYRRQYWMPPRCDLLPTGLDYMVFDFSVNSGVSRAVKELQKILGVRADGIIGEITLAAVPADPTKLLARYAAARMTFLRKLGNWPTFKNGWTTRVKEVLAMAQRMDALPPAPPDPADGDLLTELLAVIRRHEAHSVTKD